LFYGVETDAGALGDYALYSAPTTANNNPTSLNSRNASTLTGVFKSPPFAYPGAPSNLSYPGMPTWADVESSQWRRPFCQDALCRSVRQVAGRGGQVARASAPEKARG
jgi:hypothetical protein